jgi:hypothetical protein
MTLTWDDRGNVLPCLAVLVAVNVMIYHLISYDTEEPRKETFHEIPPS